MAPELDRPGAPALTRMVSAGAQDALARFSDPELLAQGQVNLISVEAVEARFGARWDVRRDQVHDFTARVLERGLGDSGFFLRVSDVDFFIVQPQLGRIAGQAACLRYLREVLNHFLGEDNMAGAGVLQVTKVVEGRVEAARMDERARRHADEAVDAPKPPDIREETPEEASLDCWTPFVAFDGRQLRVSATLEPVFELKGFSRIGFRMMRRVLSVRWNREEEELSPQEVATLSTADLLRVDLATIARGVGRLKTEAGDVQQPSLIVPVSYPSLVGQKGRVEIVNQLKVAGAMVKHGVVCEICDIEGVPQGALLSAASLVKPFTLLVVGRVTTATPTALARLDGTGLQALSITCPPNLSDPEFTAWAQPTVAAAKGFAKSVLVYGAGSPRRAATLAALGATHASAVVG